MKFLTTQIKYTNSLKKQLATAFILGLLLAFILIYLEPFDTDDFRSKYKTILLLGYGLLLFITYMVQSRIERSWYNKVHKKWIVQYEIISIVTFFIITGSFIYFYNDILINKNPYSLKYHFGYYKQIIFVFIPIFAPVLVFLRNKFGEFISPEMINEIVLKGINKKEILRIQKEDLLFVKASENYIEIYFASKDAIDHKIFRNTLSEIAKQAPFIEQCHRSYLVNLSKVKEVKGNSQKAFILFDDNLEVPLSKSYYKKFISKLSI